MLIYGYTFYEIIKVSKRQMKIKYFLILLRISIKTAKSVWYVQ